MGWWSILLSLTYLDGGLTTSLILLKRLRTSVELVFNILRMKKSETQVEGWRHQDRDLHMLVLKPFEATVGANGPEVMEGKGRWVNYLRQSYATSKRRTHCAKSMWE
ncbi:uncharacterized protein [Triticum aestivum]|uniref:uncharacterized protein isoform X1 n=1 Tax=Triticum aestivum TaxID=4565 RepID=UPI001D01984E|nr:uncharacterized protein LOC123080251 isoform X1 [Triticum aestivum]